MSSQASKKVLRLGLIQDGRIVEETFIDSPQPVTIGSKLSGNTLVAPASSLPDSIELFDYQNGRFYLRITEKLDGEVQINDKIFSLESFIEEGKAKKDGEAYLLPIPLNAEGQLRLDGISILFQFAPPPLPIKHPKLPNELKGGWSRQLNPYLVMMIAISFVLQAGFVTWLLTRDFPEPKQVSKQISDRFVEVMTKEKDEPEEQKKEKKKKQKDKKETQNKKAESQPAPEPKPDPEPKKEPEKDLNKKEKRRKKMVEKVEKKTVLSQIGADSGDEGIASQLSNLEEGAMNDAFEGSQGMTTDATGGDNLRTSGTADAEGTGKSAGIGDLGKAAGAEKAEQAGGTGSGTKEREVQANVDVGSETEVDKAKGVLDPQAVSRVIKNKYGTLRSCYVQYLNTNPEAAGKIEIKFKINPRGRVTSSSATTNTVGGTVGACVARKIQRWRFPKPKGGTITFRKTFVFEASR